MPLARRLGPSTSKESRQSRRPVRAASNQTRLVKSRRRVAINPGEGHRTLPWRRLLQLNQSCVDCNSTSNTASDKEPINVGDHVHCIDDGSFAFPLLSRRTRQAKSSSRNCRAVPAESTSGKLWKTHIPTTAEVCQRELEASGSREDDDHDVEAATY